MGNHLYFVRRSSMKITILLFCLIVALAAVNPALAGRRPCGEIDDGGLGLRSPAHGLPCVVGPNDGARGKRSPQSPPGRPKPPRGRPNRPRGGQRPPRGGPNDG